MQSFFRLLFLPLCLAMLTTNLAHAQTTIKLRDESGTPYIIAGKLISEIKVPSKEIIKTFMEYKDKSKTFRFTVVEYDNEGLLSNINHTDVPVAQMNFQTDGYGTRVEEEENDFFGKGKIANLTLLCAGQNNCFKQEKIDVWVENQPETKNTTYAMFYFTKKADAEALLKEITSKK